MERKLANQFSTRNTAVREALIELEAKGFVVKKPNFATFVTKLSLDAVDEIFMFRRIAEAFTVEEAARIASPQQIESLSHSYKELVEAASAKDTRCFSKEIWLYTS